MVVLETSQEWQTQTARLLQARPTTTRITTKYNIPNLESERFQKRLSKTRKMADAEEKEGADAAAPKVAQATLELKAYDPESGVVLKFKTNRAAEVGRLMLGLGSLGRYMAALPVKEEAQDIVMEDAAAAEETPAADSKPATTASAAAEAKPQQGGGGGGNKKKKKNKK